MISLAEISAPQSDQLLLMVCPNELLENPITVAAAIIIGKAANPAPMRGGFIITFAICLNLSAGGLVRFWMIRTSSQTVSTERIKINATRSKRRM